MAAGVGSRPVIWNWDPHQILYAFGRLNPPPQTGCRYIQLSVHSARGEILHTPFLFPNVDLATIWCIVSETEKATAKVIHLMLVKEPHCRGAPVWHALSRDFTVLPAHPRVYLRFGLFTPNRTLVCSAILWGTGGWLTDTHATGSWIAIVHIPCVWCSLTVNVSVGRLLQTQGSVNSMQWRVSTISTFVNLSVATPHFIRRRFSSSAAHCRCHVPTPRQLVLSHSRLCGHNKLHPSYIWPSHFYKVLDFSVARNTQL